MTFTDLQSDADVTAYAELLPPAIYNDTVRDSVQTSVSKGVSPEYAKDLLIQALQEALKQYAKTTGKTKAGRFMRWVASILSYLKLRP